MRDDDHRSGVIIDGLDQRRSAVDIEMVSRLVEDNKVRRVQCCEAKQQPRPLSPPDSVFTALLAARPENPIAPALPRTFAQADPASGRGRGRRGFDPRRAHRLMLGEVADLERRRARHRAVFGREAARKQFNQCGLAIAVGAEQARCGHHYRCVATGLTGRSAGLVTNIHVIGRR